MTGTDDFCSSISTDCATFVCIPPNAGNQLQQRIDQLLINLSSYAGQQSSWRSRFKRHG
jgi:hypothetical protein